MDRRLCQTTDAGSATWDGARFLAAIALASLAGCATFPPAEPKQLRFAEQVLGTNREELDWNFHALLEYKSTDNDLPAYKAGAAAPPESPQRRPDFCDLVPGNGNADVSVHGLGLQFSGYLMAVEKTRRQIIGLEGGPLSFCDSAITPTIFEQSFLRAPPKTDDGYDEATCILKRRLDDGTRMFLSHVAAFRPMPESSTPRIGGRLLYDVYGRNDLLCDIQTAESEDKRVSWEKSVFRAGRVDGLRSLEAALRADIDNARSRAAPYSHVFVYVMGWNTGQAAAMENFNNLYGYLLDAATADGNAGGRFRPLFIGITWPSAWSFGTSAWDTFLRGVSFWNKKNDADELGATWANYLLNDVLAGIKRDHPGLRVVLIGHSFGARAAARTLYSCDLLPDPAPSACRQTVDLVLGLQSAFGRSRFDKHLSPTWQQALLVHPMHHEGVPYTDFSDYRRFGAKQAYLWSRYDSATSSSAMMGGGNEFERTRREAYADLFQHLPDKDTSDPHSAVPHSDQLINMVRDLDPNNRRVLLLDGAGFVRHDTPYHGGDAHSDIYNREVGRLTWELVKKFAGTP